MLNFKLIDFILEATQGKPHELLQWFTGAVESKQDRPCFMGYGNFHEWSFFRSFIKNYATGEMIKYPRPELIREYIPYYIDMEGRLESIAFFEYCLMNPLYFYTMVEEYREHYG
jgi:hypothetical protein